MGSIFSKLLNRIEQVNYSSTPITYDRPYDYTVAGNPRPGIQSTWELAMRSMVTVELITRKLLLPTIENRMSTMLAKATYKQDKTNSVLIQFPQMEESKIFEHHDTFQIFETDEDETVDIAELILGLENVNDQTPLMTRVEMVCQHDDGTEHMKFENFLRLMGVLQSPGNQNHPLRHTFDKLQELNRYLRHMAVTQQVLTGFL